MGELYELVKAAGENGKAYSETVSKLFAEFVELNRKIDDHNVRDNEKGDNYGYHQV